MKLKKIEREIIYLLAIINLIDEMVNFEIIDLFENESHSEIRFKSLTHQKFFNILLVDFLSCSDIYIIGEQQPYLKVLNAICSNPNFNINNSICRLNKSTQCFRKWLNTELIVEKLWFPSIDLETDLVIKRIEFIKICGNISKHNFTRLSGVVRDIINIFQRNGISLDDEKALTILGEFYDWFHNNILNYHSSAIAEFLNNIRWGIYEYLKPQYSYSIGYIRKKPRTDVHNIYPKGVYNKFAKECYWNLMNECRSKPFINKFKVTKYLKMHY